MVRDRTQRQKLQGSIPPVAARMQGSASVLSPALCTSVPHHVPRSSTSCCPELDPSAAARPPSRKQTRRKRNAKVSFRESVVVKVIPEPQMPPNGDALPQQSTTNQRKPRGCLQNPSRGAPKQRAELPAVLPYEHPGGLEDVELNSTLAVKAELVALQGAEFNSQKAVKETFEKLEHTKKQINSRATRGINVARSRTLFSSLVSVDVPESELMSRVFKDRLLLGPPPRSREGTSTGSPSHLVFLPSDLFRQKPLPPEEEPFGSESCPAPRAASSTFDLYRRQRRWEASP
ncbi:protein phosphatase 1 regulatory subunit 35 [Dunckerocampus dactyliophorus]|uniref:protein phosphatase 1 regulatory subunit 35 n=1 Tax=Dunckerocampus dactyliophorus TaxID=161453 RepID=UPI0024061413|nr:protein phosphatase 1 regulatory subunit 35 [Dunckerocampus dactyliophorus]